MSKAFGVPPSYWDDLPLEKFLLDSAVFKEGWEQEQENKRRQSRRGR